MHEIEVYTNPSKDGFFIKGIKGEASIDLFSAEGRKIETKTLFNDSYLNYNLSCGIYLLKISSEEKSTIKKIVIK